MSISRRRDFNCLYHSFREHILAATDTARHAVPYVGGTVRALTVREILRLAQSHPGILEVIDPSASRNAMELFEIVGRPGVQAAVMLSSDRCHWRVRLMRDVVLLHLFLSALEVASAERATAQPSLFERTTTGML